jgi:hypothetical protein
MKHLLVLFLIFGFYLHGWSQDYPSGGDQQARKRAPIDWYKIISHQRDTTYLDTTLSIEKEYRFNYLRKDNFELLPFANVGQTYNSLAYGFNDTNLKPLFAAQSHHFNYLEIEDMHYFNVPTPLTDLYFKTVFEQGQNVDAFFTVNTSEQFNFSIAYKGLRSLGKYQQSLTSTGNLRFTTNYHSTNKRYRMRAHFAAQDILNEENGGLTDSSLQLFRTANSEFDDRARLDVNFENAENKLEGLRFYTDQEYDLVSKKDSLYYNVLTLGARLSYEDKFFEYRQNEAFDGLGEAYNATDLVKTTKLEDFHARAYSRLNNSLLGEIGAFIGYTDYNYGYNTVLILDDGRITNRLKGDLLQFGASYRKQYRGFELSGEGAINLAGDFNANYLTAAASFRFNEDNQVKASARIHSVAPNFNFLLYQSDYVNYNWQNDFDNVQTQQLSVQWESNKLFDAELSYTGADNYTYFTIRPNDSTPTPNQLGERVDYLKIKAEREFRYGKFALMNTIMYQQVLSGEEAFNVPEFITRQSLYYQDEWFKKAMFVQIGFNFKYFTSYNMNAYDPVLAEFYVQNQETIGGFPLVDFFFNARIRQTRVFLKYEHFNQLFNTSNSHFSAPGYPYRDAVIRFGLVWNFLL